MSAIITQSNTRDEQHNRQISERPEFAQELRHFRTFRNFSGIGVQGAGLIKEFGSSHEKARSTAKKLIRVVQS